MLQPDAYRAILDVCSKDPRYTSQAYVFIFEALEYTLRRLGRGGGGACGSAEEAKRHVSGQELVKGIREFALEQYGFLTRTVFESWGVTKTDDFGVIVFNMVGANLLNRRETDSLDDFKNGYDFRTAFEVEYQIQIPWDRIAGGK